MAWKSALIAALLMPCTLAAASYRCDVQTKYEPEYVYPIEQIQKYQFKVLIQDFGTTAKLSRCSLSVSAGKITCDTYEADKIVTDPNIFVKKFYDFSGQFDVQVFKDLTFVENNGRGGIAFGKCVLVAP